MINENNYTLHTGRDLQADEEDQENTEFISVLKPLSLWETILQNVENQDKITVSNKKKLGDPSDNSVDFVFEFK